MSGSDRNYKQLGLAFTIFLLLALIVIGGISAALALWWLAAACVCNILGLVAYEFLGDRRFGIGLLLFLAPLLFLVQVFLLFL